MSDTLTFLVPATGETSRSRCDTTAEKVGIHTDRVTLPTYLPRHPDKNPMFLERRVYQGSSGRVYPIPFTDRIAEEKIDRSWEIVSIENEYLRVEILPEIGGRIHAIFDKTANRDIIYRQTVIKPALVGLAGPWISGGIEFNWPQHHRPTTFHPIAWQIEGHPDGSKTVWCAEHDPMARMKGMHGVCLHPGRAFVELKARATNRTPRVQTFLWWVNIGVRVHEAYQSFFPPDVTCIADHAKRATSEFPLCRDSYYGVKYGEREKKGVPPSERPSRHVQSPRSEVRSSKLKGVVPRYAPNDLSWYSNIPTPCSYMCLDSKYDFFGGYDHFEKAGILHLANHHIAPGKKQWTWGNHEFGYAWDRNLTDPDENGERRPYIELMAGVYTDNQPDFSFLHPGETKSWSQYLYPLHEIGPPRRANLDAALAIHPAAGRRGAATIGVSVTRLFEKATILVTAPGKAKERRLLEETGDLAPGKPWLTTITLPKNLDAGDLIVRVFDREGAEVIARTDSENAGRPAAATAGRPRPQPATEPPAPEEIPSADELYITGLHLEQYRHATRRPEAYWREALERDPLDVRCNNALGLWRMRRGEFDLAEPHFRRAIERLTRRNPNPRDGEPYYNLGLCLRHRLDRDPANDADFDGARDAFYKATWNRAWIAPAHRGLAELECRRENWNTALDHLDRSLDADPKSTVVRNLKAIVLRKLGRSREALDLLRETVALDPLDWWSRHLLGEAVRWDLQVSLDLALDFARAGFFAEAIDLLDRARAVEEEREARLLSSNGDPATALPNQNRGARPMLHYCLGRLHERTGDRAAARAHYLRAAREDPDYCFPSRLEEIAILESAIHANPSDAKAPYYLGNLFYDRRRHADAIRCWEQSAELDPDFSIVWRNLGIGYFNVLNRPGKARAAYNKAFRANPADARLLFERDQLWKRLGVSPEKRLRELASHPDLVGRRDDLSLELCALLNQTGQPEEAARVLSERRFQPWEGGEGKTLGEHSRTFLALGQRELAAGDAEEARRHFEHALTSPENLGEATHPLANRSDIRYWLGLAFEQLGQKQKAREQWRIAATFEGDFQEMAVQSYSEMTYYSTSSLRKLGKADQAEQLLSNLLAHARKLYKSPAKIDYFATSLPAMLLFHDDLRSRQETTALFLEAQARLGLGDRKHAARLLKKVLERDPSHALAADLKQELS